MKVPSTGHRGQRSAEPMSESDSDAIDKERRCRLADGATAKKKKPACLEGKQAGVNIARRNTAESRTDKSSYRGIERANLNRPCMVDAKPCGTEIRSQNSRTQDTYSISRRRHVRMKASRRKYCLRLPVLGSMGASGSGLSSWASKRDCHICRVASSSGVEGCMMW